MINLKNLDTEKVNQLTKSIDTMETNDILTTINNEDKLVALAVEKSIPEITKAIDIAYSCLKDGGRLIYFGAGTSGRLGVLDASECPPTYGVSPELVQAFIAGGDTALRIAKEGAEDNPNLAQKEFERIGLTAKDCVCGLAASGRTPFVVGGLQYAQSIGAKTISICCVNDGQISKYSDGSIEVIVGPEVITGSTRMKAGTAQKMILNMISTTCMIKLGKVFGNLMVDLKATNHKLVERGRRIIIEATGCSYESASDYLTRSDDNVKLAIAMILTGESKEQVEKILVENEGSISGLLNQNK